MRVEIKRLDVAAKNEDETNHMEWASESCQMEWSLKVEVGGLKKYTFKEVVRFVLQGELFTNKPSREEEIQAVLKAGNLAMHIC